MSTMCAISKFHKYQLGIDSSEITAQAKTLYYKNLLEIFLGPQ